jgi:hypothetical protein
MLGTGVSAPDVLPETTTVWLEGPVIPLPDSQQAEDYPKDHAAWIDVAADAPLGIRHWRVWTAQGATPALRFVVGDLPEIVEEEIDGDAVPVAVTLPVTVNGRIFPREDVDFWSFRAKRGDVVTCVVEAARLGSPLDARIELLDPSGRRLAECDDALGADPRLSVAIPEDGTYQVKIHDVNVRGGQALVYRLTLTTAPYVESTYPLGGRRGSETAFELHGTGLPAERVPIALPCGAPSEFVHTLSLRGGTTNPVALAVDDLPESLEEEPNDSGRPTVVLTPPVIANGRIGRQGDVDCWHVALEKGVATDFRVIARALGSPVDAIVTIVDKDGKELGRAEGPGKADPRLIFSAPATATYCVKVEDRFRSLGGPRYAYRLRIARPSEPDFHLRFENDALTVLRGSTVKLRVVAERLGGFSAPLALEVEGLPIGVSASPTVISAKQNAAEIVLKADRTARVGGARLTIRGTADEGAAKRTRTATKLAEPGVPELDSVLLAVALPTPFNVTGATDFRWAPRGTVRHRRFRINRGGFRGPIEVRLADRQARHLQGVTGPVLTIPPGESEFDYPATLPAWMETGRTSRSVVMAIGALEDPDGTIHEVSTTSPQADLQIIAVVEPGRLAVELGCSSVGASPGGTSSVPVRIVRGKGLRGAAKLELIVPSHLSAIAADPVDVAADQSAATLRIAFAALPETINMPVIIRATIVDQGDPVVAEAKLEIVREDGPRP